MKTSVKIAAMTVLLATAVFSTTANAQLRKASTTPAEPATVNNQADQERELNSFLDQGYQQCLANSHVLADVSQMRQSGKKEADAKKEIAEAYAKAPKELQDDLKRLVEQVYKDQPIQKTEQEKRDLVEDVLFGSFYECAVSVGYSLAKPR